MHIPIKFLDNFKIGTKLFLMLLFLLLYWKFVNCEHVIHFGFFKELFVFLLWPVGLVVKSWLLFGDHFEGITFHLFDVAVVDFGKSDITGLKWLNIRNFLHLNKLKWLWLLHMEIAGIIIELFLALETLLLWILQKLHDFRLKRSVGLFI